MKNDLRMQSIRDRLTDAFAPTFLQVIDESDQHRGHTGAQGGAGHYAIKISATCFNQQKTVAAHRMIYQALQEMFPKQIHALRITILPIE